MGLSAVILEDLYVTYNRREFVHPDPVEFLYRFEDLMDREIVGLIASSLAYGNVVQILGSVSRVLEKMPSPYSFLKKSSQKSLLRMFSDFKHRFTTGGELAALLYGIKRTVERYGSLQACFMAGLNDKDSTVLPALCAFVSELSSGSDVLCGHFLPSPSRGSACKRLNLFLRWMVRSDEVDPGGWRDVPAYKLLVPLDTHMHRICLALGLTRRKGADMRTAIEVTDSFRAISPDDPVRYDFALTRLGIRKDADVDAFMKRCGTEHQPHVLLTAPG